jgi:hypothetical protein
MHPTITNLIANQRVDEARRMAREHASLAGDGWPTRPTWRRAFSRYFHRASEADIKPVRRTGRRARGAGARLT